MLCARWLFTLDFSAQINRIEKNSAEKKDKQRLKRSFSETDLQNKTNRFQRDILHQLKKPRIEKNTEGIDQAKDQPTQEIEKIIEQCAQAIMSRYFGDITKLLVDFEGQGVRLLHPGESSSTVDATLSSQKHSEESTSGLIPDEFVKGLYETHTSTFDRVFQPAFEQARQENQSEGDALLQAAAHAHQRAYDETFRQAKQLVSREHMLKDIDKISGSLMHEIAESYIDINKKRNNPLPIKEYMQMVREKVLFKYKMSVIRKIMAKYFQIDMGINKNELVLNHLNGIIKRKIKNIIQKDHM